MNAQMKGVLKGLRYISKIFDGKEEQDMQIGYPTDVKHVAHIGWDGPSVNAPTWMNEFSSATHSAPFASDGRETNSSNKWAAQDSGGSQKSPGREKSESTKPRRRRQPSIGGPEDSPGREREASTGRSRRNQSDALPGESPIRESSRRGRRHNKSTESGETDGDLPAIPKQSKPRKTKGSSGGSGGSTRSKARSRAALGSSTDPGQEEDNARLAPAMERADQRDGRS